MFVDEVAYEGQRLGATESSDLFTFINQQHRRKTAHLVTTSQFHVLTFVDFDLGQADLTVTLFDESFQYRCDDQARRTPFGPKVYQHGLVMRRLQHLFFKVIEVDIKNQLLFV